ncbi:uncharacterized protein E0L32_011417, partial [Thyridium curvatum]
MVGLNGQDVEMRNYSSSPTSLSSPPSGSLSEPGSPSRLNAGRANIATDEMDEIIVDLATGSRLNVPQTQAHVQQPPPQQQYPEGVRLTVHGVPRKKPGRKPGSTVKPKPAADGSSTNTEAPKVRRPRKPRDPNAPPIQRKRKSAPPADMPAAAEPTTFTSASGRQPKITELTSMRMDIDSRPQSVGSSQPPEKMAKREAMPTSMQSILNADPPPHTQHSPPSHSQSMSRGQSYDPIRSSTYDPVRETMLSRDPYGTGPLGSPRAPAQVPNRTSASPSIASLVDPPPFSNMRSPGQSYSTAATSASRYPDSGSHPPSPSNTLRSVSGAAAAPTAPKASSTETKKAPPLPSAPTTIKKAEEAKAAALGTSGRDVTMSGTTSASSKKSASAAQQERKQPRGSSRASSPKLVSLKDVLPPIPDLPERSILDFGKVNPGEEATAPSIILHVPLNGETNKYINFMRMAEEQYGWDALHPRLAAHRDRKARIAAASAALEKQGSGRESGDEMSVDLQSGDEGSNAEGPNGGGTSGPDGAPAKPVRKKRNFKEDEYDKDDDFVDDSEMLWEEQAAASRDGFFVYSGPLVQEEAKPAV